jgi:hypothetical protein
MRFNDKTGEMEVFATKREVELGYNSNVNVIVKDGKVSGIIESNAASISSDPETNMVTIKVTDQYKGAKVTIYNELGQPVKSENADTETGEVTFDGARVRDGGYSVKVEGQLDIIPGLDIEAEGKTQSQIQSDPIPKPTKKPTPTKKPKLIVLKPKPRPKKNKMYMKEKYTGKDSNVEFQTGKTKKKLFTGGKVGGMKSGSATPNRLY